MAHARPQPVSGSQQGRCFSFCFLTPVVQDGSQAPLGMPRLLFQGRAGLIHFPLPTPPPRLSWAFCEAQPGHAGSPSSGLHGSEPG